MGTVPDKSPCGEGMSQSQETNFVTSEVEVKYKLHLCYLNTGLLYNKYQQIGVVIQYSLTIIATSVLCQI